MTMRKVLLLSLAAASLTCAGALMTAPPGSTLTLTANPGFIPANGGVSVLSAFVIEPAGTTVPDGTIVQFFTTLGRIDPREGRTRDGVARVNLISDARSGTANITAVSGGAAAPAPSPTPSPSAGPAPITGSATGTTSVVIGGAQSLQLIVTADPSRITDSRSTHIIANVFDGNGNPAANIPVIFQVISNTFTDFMESQSNPLFTDNNGRVEDIFRTRRTPPVVSTAEVRVTALSLNTPSATVTVPILLP